MEAVYLFGFLAVVGLLGLIFIINFDIKTNKIKPFWHK